MGCKLPEPFQGYLFVLLLPFYRVCIPNGNCVCLIQTGSGQNRTSNRTASWHPWRSEEMAMDFSSRLSHRLLTPNYIPDQVSSAHILPMFSVVSFLLVCSTEVLSPPPSFCPTPHALYRALPSAVKPLPLNLVMTAPSPGS